MEEILKVLKKYISKITNTSTFLNGVKKDRIIKNEFSNLKIKAEIKLGYYLYLD